MDTSNLEILKTKDADLKEILFVEKAAFDRDEEADLTADLIKDETAQPVLSLLAYDQGKPVGHILFTKASVEGWFHSEHAYILAPMAVIPEYQNQGIGSKLIEEGLKKLKTMGVEMVFVLGDPGYYKKHGFIPNAKDFGFQPPYPINHHEDAWMVQGLTIKGLSKNVGKVVCAESLDNPKFWKE